MKRVKYNETSLFLLNAGVSREALATTLPRVGRQTLRDMALSGFVDDEGHTCNLIVQTEECIGIAQIGNPDLVFNLVVKELLLNQNLVWAPTNDEFLGNDYATLTSFEYIALPYFYVPGAVEVPYGEPRIMESMFSRVRTCFYRYNIPFILYVQGELRNANKWWPMSMIDFLAKTSVITNGVVTCQQD